MTEQTYRTGANVARAEFSSLVNTVQVRVARMSIDKLHLAHKDATAGTGHYVTITSGVIAGSADITSSWIIFAQP